MNFWSDGLTVKVADWRTQRHKHTAKSDRRNRCTSKKTRFREGRCAQLKETEAHDGDEQVLKIVICTCE